MNGITNTYNFSESFMYINQELDFIYDSFNDYIKEGKKVVDKITERINTEYSNLNKILKEKYPDGQYSESQYAEFLNEYENPELSYDEQKKHKLELAFLNSGLMYICSQFEVLYEMINKSTAELFSDFNIIVTNKQKINKKNKTSIIQKSKNNIEENSGIDFSNNNELHIIWRKISDYYKIRNKIIHKNGKLNEEIIRDKIIKKIYAIKIDGSIMLLTKEFLFSVNNDMLKYLKESMNIIYEKYKDKS